MELRETMGFWDEKRNITAGENVFICVSGLPIMNIVIAGAGEIGSNIAIRLSEEGHNVSIIEQDIQACRKMEILDVLTVMGSASDPEKLKEAGIEDADSFIAVTGSDEVNLTGCTLAKFKMITRELTGQQNGNSDEVKKLIDIKLNRRLKTIARVNNVDLMDNAIDTEKFMSIGVDIAFCPDQMAARHIGNVLLTPSLFNMKLITETKTMVMEAEIKDFSPVVGLKYKEISDIFDYANIVLIFRKSEVIIPKKNSQFLPGDRVQILVLKNEVLPLLERHFGRGLRQVNEEDTVKRVIILGATRIGIKLSLILKMDKRQRRHITLVDKNQEDVDLANRVFARLGLNISVIKGMGSDVNLLKDNRISKVDAFVAATQKEQTNIISCLLAKKLGATRTIAIIENEELHPLLETMSIDTVVNTKLSAVSTIFPFIISKNIEAMSIIGGDAQAVELRIPKKSNLDGKLINKLSIPTDVIIGALIRGKKTFVPKKGFELKAGDKIILFGKGNFITDLSALF